MKTLIIGSGGREHAIAWSLRRSNPDLKIFCAPGNAGIAEVAQCVPISIGQTAALANLAETEKVNLTIVGPEVPLAEGLVDEFASHGLVVFGPSKAAARLEASKSFAKQFMARNRIPSARFRIAESSGEALTILRSGEFGSNDHGVVVKIDGLAAGKGVVVADTALEAEQAVADLEKTNRQARYVIEETLMGTEASILVFADGRDYALMPPARDHKRIGENETGPNTGGMGSITGPAVIDDHTLDLVRAEILDPTLEGAQKEGFPFKGVLFVGLMLTSDGPKVLEYNVRFGDPETQAILIRLNNNLLSVFEASCQGRLADTRLKWKHGSSACVVIANRGYPGKFESGAVIEGLPRVDIDGSVQVFHAGTAKSKSGEIVASGGRVLGVTAAGVTLSEALSRCYETVGNIRWNGMQYRRDIGRTGGLETTAFSGSQ